MVFHHFDYPHQEALHFFPKFWEEQLHQNEGEDEEEDAFQHISSHYE